jgi:hypothetical protein
MCPDELAGIDRFVTQEKPDARTTPAEPEHGRRLMVAVSGELPLPAGLAGGAATCRIGDTQLRSM